MPAFPNSPAACGRERALRYLRRRTFSLLGRWCVLVWCLLLFTQSGIPGIRSTGAFTLHTSRVLVYICCFHSFGARRMVYLSSIAPDPAASVLKRGSHTYMQDCNIASPDHQCNTRYIPECIVPRTPVVNTIVPQPLQHEVAPRKHVQACDGRPSRLDILGVSVESPIGVPDGA